MSRHDRFTVPGLEADQRILDTTLMVFGHVLMHIWIVLPDVALGAAIRNSPEAKRRGVRVGTLELQRGVQNRDGLLKKMSIKKIVYFHPALNVF